MSNFFEVQGLGPVDLFRIEFPDDDEGGCTLIRGRNEAGKSTCLEAIDALISGDASRLAPNNAGPGVGYVRGPGREIKITQKTARQKAGEDAPSLRAIASADLATFMAPGFQSDEVNDRARIRELAKLTGAQLTPEDFCRNMDASGRAILRRNMKPEHATLTDPVELASRVKAAMDKAARDEEAEADRLTGRVAEIEATAAGLDLTIETRPDILDGALRAAVRDVERAKAQRSELAVARRRQEDALARLQEFRTKAGAPDAEAAEKQLARAEHDVAARKEECDTAESRVAQLEQALREAKAAHDAAGGRFRAALDMKVGAERLLAVARQAGEAVAGWQATADATLPEAPGDEVMALLEKTERAALDAQALGTEAARAKDRLAEAKEVQVQRDAAAARARAWRDAAGSVDEVLTDVVRRTGIDDLKVSEGFMVVRNHAGWLPLHKLSGAAAAEVTARIWFRQAAKMRKPGEPAPKVLLRQEAWDGMLAPAQNRVIRLAHEEHVRLIAAEAWPCELQAVELEEARDAR